MDRGEDLGQRDQLVRSVSVVLTDARASPAGEELCLEPQ